MMKRYVLLFLLLISFGLQANFRASVVTVDITPKSPKMLLGYGARQSIGVRDRIFHRIVLMDDGFTQFLLVSSELCVMSPATYDQVAAEVDQKLGINPINFWWTLTHTHSAPELGTPGLPAVFMSDRYQHPIDFEYLKEVKQKLIDGIVEARRMLRPVNIGFGMGESKANINRRERRANGKIALGFYPEGPVDNQIGLIRLDNLDGSPLAIIANFPIHGTFFGQDNLYISGDVPGLISRYVQEKLKAPVLFINGAAGNLAPNTMPLGNKVVSKDTSMRFFKEALGDKIVDIYKSISQLTQSMRISSGATQIESLRKKSLTWIPELKAYEKKNRAGEDVVILPARFLKFNQSLAIWSLPGELFCEISNEIRKISPFDNTFFYGYTNGWLGYIPTAKEYVLGGYEVETVSPFTSSVEADVQQFVGDYFKNDLVNTPFPVDSVNRPSRVLVEKDGSLRLTAEKGKAIGPKIQYMPEWRAFGWFTAKDEVVWDVQVPESGNYEVLLEWSVADAEAGKYFLLSSSKGSLKKQVRPSGSWENYAAEIVGKLPLKKGKERIRFKSNDYFKEGAILDLREIRLRKVVD
jgi:uncharacterized protein YxjI